MMSLLVNFQFEDRQKILRLCESEPRFADFAPFFENIGASDLVSLTIDSELEDWFTTIVPVKQKLLALMFMRNVLNPYLTKHRHTLLVERTCAMLSAFPQLEQFGTTLNLRGWHLSYSMIIDYLLPAIQKCTDEAAIAWRESITRVDLSCNEIQMIQCVTDLVKLLPNCKEVVLCNNLLDESNASAVLDLLEIPSVEIVFLNGNQVHHKLDSHPKLYPVASGQKTIEWKWNNVAEFQRFGDAIRKIYHEAPKHYHDILLELHNSYVPNVTQTFTFQLTPLDLNYLTYDMRYGMLQLPARLAGVSLQTVHQLTRLAHL